MIKGTSMKQGSHSSGISWKVLSSLVIQWLKVLEKW